jgi:hypothetical protein
MIKTREDFKASFLTSSPTARRFGQVKAVYAHQTRRRWGHTAMRGWAKLAIDRRYLAGIGHSAWSAPPRAVDEDPDEAGALLDFHFTNPSAVRDVSKKLHV